MLLTLFYMNIVFFFCILFTTSLLIYNHLKMNFIICNIFYMFVFNEPITNWLASFWVIPITIIPFFYLLIFVLYLIIRKDKIITYFLTITSHILLLFFGYIYTKYNLTTLLYVVNFEINYENLLLSNFINKYHPAILYSTVGLLFILLFYYVNNFFLTPKILYVSVISYNQNLSITILNTPLIASALFLGSFWAVQEVSWGGWWNWDSSENIGLLVSIIIFFNLHKFYTTKLDLFWYTYNIIGLIILVTLYKSVQLTFDESSHNFDFGSVTLSRLFFCRWDYVIIALTVLSSILLSFYRSNILLVLFYTAIQNHSWNSEINLFWVKFVLLITVIGVIFVSLDFLWETFFFNYDKPADDLIYILWEYFLYVIYFFLINLIINLDYKIFFLTLFLTPFLISLYLYVLFTIRHSFYLFLHNFIILAIIINFYSKIYNTLEISYSTNLFSSNELLYFYLTPLTVNYTLNNSDILTQLTRLINFTLLSEATGFLNSKKEFINEYVSYWSQINSFYLTTFFTIENFYTYITLTDNILIYLIFVFINFFTLFFILLLQA